jgi:hypothetical protein
MLGLTLVDFFTSLSGRGEGLAYVPTDAAPDLGFDITSILL